MSIMYMHINTYIHVCIYTYIHENVHYKKKYALYTTNFLIVAILFFSCRDEVLDS